jgi:putative membrane protein
VAATVKLTDAERAEVGAAVARAEEASAGEIVTIMAASSDDYHDVALWWSAVAAFLALAALGWFWPFYLARVDWLTGSWQSEWQPGKVLGLALILVTAKFAGLYLLQLWRPLRLALVPGALKHRRVRNRAVTAFRIGAERRTHGRTGVLIYLSLAEHRAEIVADEAIASKVAPEVWGDAMATLVGGIRTGQAAQGLIGAVEQVGAVLAQHFPRAADDTNELPDRLIEV